MVGQVCLALPTRRSAVRRKVGKNSPHVADVGTGSSGAGGALCGGDYLCVADPGCDAPARLGTPDGTGAF